VAQLPSVDELMARLLARLPSQPVRIEGELVTVPAKGAKTRLSITIQLRYPHEATYTIGDVFGRALEQLTVQRDAAGKATYLYLAGHPPAATTPPPLSTRIQDTALTWMDLTLGFLWWSGGRIIGQEENRGQPCYVLDRRPPQGAMAPYSSVRLWVDKRASVLLQADAFDKLGEPARRLAVKSIKKINNEWMIKDLVVEELPTGAQTTLRVHDTRDPDAAPDSASP
jgi:hypothetical protein